jgi:hypothetical protein
LDNELTIDKEVGTMRNRFLLWINVLCRLGSILVAGLIILTICFCPALFTVVQSTRADSTSSAEQDSNTEIAKELSNPIADLVHLPIQMNYEQDIGSDDDGWRLQTNLQPVIPFHLTKDWNLISRTIIPVTHQEDIFPGSGSQSGLGDTTLSLFFNPKKRGGILWGAGPILHLPTATDSRLGAEKWGAGPSAIVLTQRGPWTVGTLGHHIWSFAGDRDRADLNFTFLQPFAAYTWPSAWTASVGSESNYNWKTDKWSVPANVALSKVVRLGKLPVRFQTVVGYFVESSDEGPEGFRFRFQVNLVLPRRR